MLPKLLTTFFCFFCLLLLVVVQLTETRSMTHHSPGEEEETVHLLSMNGDDQIHKESEGTNDGNKNQAIISASKRSINIEELTSSSTGISLMWKEIVSSLSLAIQKMIQSLCVIFKRFFDSNLQSIVSLVRDRVLPVWLFFPSYVQHYPIVRSALTNHSSSSL